MKSPFASMATTCLVVFAAIAARADVVETLPDTSRLVAVGGSITEIIYALGEEDHLIARDTTSVYPQAALALPDVGYMRALSPEGVLSIDPSAILMMEGSGPPEAIDVLKKASVPIAIVPERFDSQGILTKITTIGRAIGEEEKAGQLAAKVAADLADAEASTAHVAERRRVLFVLSNQGGKLLASGTGTAADGIIKMAGGINVMSEFTGYKQLADEAVITAQPDLILMMNARDRPNGEVDTELLAQPAVAATPAGRNKAILHMDGAYLLGFGPRTAAAVRDLAVALYGQAITD
ncbi:MAG: ABC transporter substrate-binding protein [Rhizobiaceae bacterium]